MRYKHARLSADNFKYAMFVLAALLLSLICFGADAQTIEPNRKAGEHLMDAATVKTVGNICTLTGGGMLAVAVIANDPGTEVFYWVGGGVLGLAVVADFVAWRHIGKAGRALTVNAGGTGLKLNYRF